MMIRMRSLNAVQRSFLAVAAATLALLSGCQTTPTAKAPSAPTLPPTPTLQLLEAKPLVVAADCAASGSYFVGFTVQRDGRAAQIAAPAAAPACVQQALAAWVSSFRYAPPPADTPFGIEWMLVTARRGS
jgi:hypothetical protein